ncbi:MAG: acyl-CoA dehydrogenase family protein [Acidobacteriota bacterium]
MNFELTEEQRLVKEMIREFAKNEVEPRAKSLEEKSEFPEEIMNKLSDLGILGMSVPQEFGGIKTDFLSNIVTIEEISRVLPSLAVIISVHCSLFCYSVNKYGTSAQKKKYLPRAAAGEILGAFSLTEPGAGSDVTGIQTTARKKGDQYILNGTKAWVTNGNNAQAFILFAQTEKDQTSQKLSVFILDRDTPGFQVSKIEKKMGLHASPTAEIVLDNCSLPQENLLGEEGMGAKIALHCLDVSRIGIAAQAVGLAQRALDESIFYSRQRQAFDQNISDFQAIQFMIADMSTLLEASRWLTYKAATLFDKEKPFTREAAQAKLFSTEAANKIVYSSLQIHGGYGYSREFLIEQLYRDARVLTLYEGTSEIQRIVISRSLLQGK